ncbi:MAG TPA: hypothetical protein VHC42_09955 [Rhizomicrobium sp.]|nr:hypothetical protein [Rhizomicrobium sp.]
MDIHRPKAAVHGWRELLKEIGIIVIGVVIALGAEQAVDAVHWMNQVNSGEATLKGAFVREVQNAALRDAQAGCIARRMSFLSAVLQRATDDGRLPAIGPIGHPPFTPWTIGSWEGLVTSQTVAHMPRRKMIDYSRIAQMSVFLSGLSDREEAQWTILDTMAGPGRRLSDAEAEELRITLAEASDSDRYMRRTGDSLRDNVKATGLLTKSEFEDAVKLALDGAKDSDICAPMKSSIIQGGEPKTHG